MTAPFPAFYITLMHNVVQINSLVKLIMVDHQKSAGFKPTDMEPGAWTINMAFSPGRPCTAIIIGKAFSDTVKRARQHPKRAIFLFNNHVFVETTIGNVCVSTQTDCFSLVRRSIDIGKLLCLQTMALCRDAAAGIAPNSSWKQPFSFGCNQWFICLLYTSLSHGSR